MRALAEMDGSGLVPLLVQDQAADLARMHALFGRVEGGSELLRAGMVRAHSNEHQGARLRSRPSTHHSFRPCIDAGVPRCGGGRALPPATPHSAARRVRARQGCAPAAALLACGNAALTANTTARLDGP